MYKIFVVAGLAAGMALAGCQNKRQDPAAGSMGMDPLPPISDPSYPPPMPPTAPEPTFADPGPAWDAVPAGGAPAPGSTYTVQRGDTLYSIARRVYGDPSRWRDIQAANPGLEPTKMRVGQTINLP